MTEELLVLDAETRKMEVEIYGKTLALEVREPTTQELVTFDRQFERAGRNQRAGLIRKVGARHLMGVRGIGITDENGAVVPLVTDPNAPGYRADWKQRLFARGVGYKLAVSVVVALYRPTERTGMSEEEIADGLEGDELGELDAAPEKKAGRKS